MNPALACVEAIVADVAAGQMSVTHALAELRSRHYTPDPEALHDAVALMRRRDRTEDTLGDALTVLSVRDLAATR